MCGRPRKWFTEEDRIAAINASNRKYTLKMAMAKDAGTAKNKAKHKYYRYPGIKVILETFDKFFINTVCISYVIGVKWIDDIERLDVFESVCDEVMQNWLEEQTVWSPNTIYLPGIDQWTITTDTLVKDGMLKVNTI